MFPGVAKVPLRRKITWGFGGLADNCTCFGRIGTVLPREKTGRTEMGISEPRGASRQAIAGLIA
jgi:hypothetical protein